MIFSQVGSDQGAFTQQVAVALPFRTPVQGVPGSNVHLRNGILVSDGMLVSVIFVQWRNQRGKGVSQFVKALSKMSKILPPLIELAMGAFF